MQRSYTFASISTMIDQIVMMRAEETSTFIIARCTEGSTQTICYKPKSGQV